MVAEYEEDNSLNILVVEDDEGVNRLVQKQLVRAGYTVQGVMTGKEALEILDGSGARDRLLLLLDQKLPDMDGTQLVHTMVDQGNGVPFIVMTGQGDETLAVDMMKLGARDYVVKGVDFLDRLPPVVDRVAREIHAQVRFERVRRSLEETEDRYWSILHSAMDGFWLVDGRGRITQVNATYCRMSGFAEDELLGRPIADLEVCEDSRGVAAHTCRIIEKGEDRFVTVHRRKDGSTFDVEVSAQYRPVDQGRFIVFIRDISEKIRAESDLRQSEGEKSLILESISDVVAFYNSPDLDIAWTNRKAGQTVGSRPAQLIGKKCHQVWAGSHSPCNNCPVLETFRTGRKAQGEQSTPDGREWSLRAYPAFNELGLLEGVVEVGREITQARMNEKSLRGALERITFLVGNSPLAVIEWDAGNQVAAWSVRAESMFGWSAEEAIGKSWRDLGLIPREDVEEVEGRIGEMFSRERCNSTIRNRNLTRNGRVLDCVWYNSAFKDAEGNVLTILSQVEDITAQKEAEKENKQLEMQIRQAQKLESIGRLAGGVAHDLNNLLSPILGYSEIVLADTSINDPRFESVEQIVTAGERARDLVHQLLTFSRKQPQSIVPVDLNDLLVRFWGLLKRTIREDIHIQMELGPDLPPVEGDIGHLEQVVMNLAVNAQDAMDAGGELVVTTRSRILESGDVAGHKGIGPGGYVLLEVRDTGHGMDGDTLDHIFEPFYTTKQKDKGTGLGLATVYGIVKQHGGEVRVESMPGQGTTFYVSLPAMQQDLEGSVQPERQNSFSAPGDGAGAGTILLVEDNEQVRELAMTILTREGYNVLTARDGGQAKEVFGHHQGRVALLLTDVIMPGMNGKELYEDLATAQPGLDVVFMSGYTDDVIAQQGVLAEGIHFLQKPFSINALKETVHGALQKQRDRG
ncbi:PAS domain-containing hybrid sensor histidine kinase/response regulator [Desulfoplanes sp.]